jgi:hypothetical protein
MDDVVAMVQPRCWCLRPKGRRSLATNRLEAEGQHRMSQQMEDRNKNENEVQ